MATTTTNFGWDIPQSTDLVKDGATAIAALGQDIDTALVDLKGGTTGQVLAKATNTDLDFSWVAQDDSNAIQNSIVDAKGDLISATADNTPARLAVGTNGHVLTADSTTATGLKWATPSAAAGLTLITSQAFTTSTGVNVNSVFNSTYTNYRIILRITGTSAGGDAAVRMRMRVSGTDSTTNYIDQRIYSFGTSVGAEQTTNWAPIDINPAYPDQASSFDIFNPALAKHTIASGLYSKTNNAGVSIQVNISQWHYAATVYDGFSLTPTSGNITGTVEIYGYAK
jgi:hypothetical protein